MGNVCCSENINAPPYNQELLCPHCCFCESCDYCPDRLKSVRVESAETKSGKLTEEVVNCCDDRHFVCETTGYIFLDYHRVTRCRNHDSEDLKKIHHEVNGKYKN